MLTYTGRRNRYGKLTNNEESANLTLGDGFMNDTDRRIGSMEGGDWWWLERTDTITTVASQEAYQLPNSVRKIIDLYVTVGTTIYRPRPIENEGHWSRVLQMNLGEADRPLFYYRRGNQVLLAPTPGSTAGTITVTSRQKQVDLSEADEITGTVSITNATTAVTGVGTTFTVGMVGSFIRFTDGDDEWYEIGSFTNTTEIDLVKNYDAGTAVSGSAFIIGEVSLIPEQYQEASVFRATAIYWDMQGDPGKANAFWQLYDGGFEKGIANERRGVIGDMLLESSEKVEGAYSNDIQHVLDNQFIDTDFIATSNFS